VSGDLALQRVLVVVVVAPFVVVLLVVFALLLRRHRLFTHGLRGTALVVDVRPSSMRQRRSLTERPTDVVTVATAARPRGVRTNQKVPPGQYAPGQVVPVVQDPRHPDRILLDRPDLERPPLMVWGPLAVALLAPLIVWLGLTRG
jgi:hypothetical protein